MAAATFPGWATIRWYDTPRCSHWQPVSLEGVGVSAKLSPHEAFVDHMEDAKALMRYARAFKNKRNRRMRQELRSRVGDALKVPVTQQEDLDCLESDDLFVVFMPDGASAETNSRTFNPYSANPWSRHVQP